MKLLQNALRWRRFGRSLRISAIAEGAGAGLLFDELLQRELVAKVILPVCEASWGTGGQEVAAKVSSEGGGGRVRVRTELTCATCRCWQ